MYTFTIKAFCSLCGPVPNDPWTGTGTGPQPGSWGPLFKTLWNLLACWTLLTLYNPSEPSSLSRPNQCLHRRLQDRSEDSEEIHESLLEDLRGSDEDDEEIYPPSLTVLVTVVNQRDP